MNSMKDFDFDLPDELIALTPVRPRSSSKLLVFSHGKVNDSHFSKLPHYLSSKDRLVFNDTEVIRARLKGYRARSNESTNLKSKIEILLETETSENTWTAFCKPLKKLRVGDFVDFGPTLSAEVISHTPPTCSLRFSKSGLALKYEISRLGQLPLPPYISNKRNYFDADNFDYQTIFAKNPGAIASPTASLHFDEKLIELLKFKQIPCSFITLHVGAGTFMPIRAKTISNHKIHSEVGIISKQTANEINTTRENGGRIVAVGTTSLRLLETASSDIGKMKEFSGKTEIFIKPGYKFKCVSGLITNFHFPKSTLLLLVAAFVGLQNQKDIYRHAISRKYRFYSYGDGSLLFPNH